MNSSPIPTYQAPYALVCPRCSHRSPLLSPECRYCSTQWRRDDVERALASHNVDLAHVEAEAAAGLQLGLWQTLTASSGRLSVLRYWIAIVPIVALNIWAVEAMLASRGLVIIGLGFLALAITWCQLSITAKRLHDFDFSGSWAIAVLIPFVALVAQIVVGVVPGTKGANRFSPSTNTLPHPAAT